MYWDELKEEILNSHYSPGADQTCRVCDCSHPELHETEDPPPAIWSGGYNTDYSGPFPNEE